jgi:Flp pilus assembly protein TadB
MWKTIALIAFACAMITFAVLFYLNVATPKLNLAEGVFVSGILVLCGVVAYRFQQRRERRQLDLIRDSALW